MTYSEAIAQPLSRRWTWLAWVNVVLGAWEIVAPWVWGYTGISSAGRWNDIVIGILILAVSLWAVWSRYSWPSLWNVLFGIWLLAAPFLLHYNLAAPNAKTNDIIVGILAIIFGIFASLLKPGWCDEELSVKRSD